MKGTLDRIAACDQGSKDPSLCGSTKLPDGHIAFQFQSSDRPLGWVSGLYPRGAGAGDPEAKREN